VSEPTPDREALDTAKGLTDALKGVRDELQRLNERVSRSRHMIFALALSLCVDVALTVILGLVAVQAHDASNQAASATSQARHAYASNFALCQASNTSRRQTIGVWDTLLGDLGKPKTQAARVFEQSFKAYLARTYAPRDCKSLGAGGK
jgi:hypothetical protein